MLVTMFHCVSPIVSDTLQKCKSQYQSHPPKMLVTMSVTPSKNVSLNISHTHQKFTMLVTPSKNNSHNVSHTSKNLNHNVSNNLRNCQSQCQSHFLRMLVTMSVTKMIVTMLVTPSNSNVLIKIFGICFLVFCLSVTFCD